MFAGGLMVVPPFIAAVAADRPLPRPSLLTALSCSRSRSRGRSPIAAPAYTHEQPLRRVRAGAPGGDASTATWEVASVEPGLDLGAGCTGRMDPDRR